MNIDINSNTPFLFCSKLSENEYTFVLTVIPEYVITQDLFEESTKDFIIEKFSGQIIETKSYTEDNKNKYSVRFSTNKYGIPGICTEWDICLV